MTQYIVTNISGGSLIVGSLVFGAGNLPAGANFSMVVNSVDQNLMNALNSGKVSITPDPRISLTAPAVSAQASIPFISLSSGSVAANGTISGITALPYIPPAAWCYFPANILAASIAAGWYYCTFSGTAAGIAYLNQPVLAGPIVVPTTLVPVTAGQGAFTGDTGEEFGPTISVPSYALGFNGMLRHSQQCSCTNNANVKTARLRLSGNAGTIFLSHALASVAVGGYQGAVENRGATNSQFSEVFGVNGGTVTGNVLGTVDTTAATTGVLSLQKATATDNLILETFVTEILPK